MKPYDSERGKKEQVQQMFDNIAPTYDALNHTLSAGIDRLWRRRAVRIVAGRNPRRILDVASGTGDLALALARRMKEAKVTGADISEGMLAIAREKAGRAGLADRTEFVAGDAEALDFADGSFDAATVAFGVRNFGDIDAGLREIRRVLRSGGMLTVLELSTPRNRAVGWLYGVYAHRILPWVGGVVSKDRAAYRYLPESVDEFPAPGRFVEMMSEAGFNDCRTRSLTFGVARIYTGVK